MQIHCYRATLETLLVKQNPPIRRAGLCGVKNAHLLSFEDYYKKGILVVLIEISSIFK